VAGPLRARADGSMVQGRACAILVTAKKNAALADKTSQQIGSC
jgi:hypothetical protein